MSATDLVLGTAGHIDHGKSSLVLALTGTDPDRLAEEKQRGITIELGFARLALPSGRTLGVVDVPGHERFVRQMIAGSTGIDLALLCIAADDGIMPQTLEHLAVLELLQVPTIVVALTKTDLVDEEWVDFMIDEVASCLASTPYARAEIVPVSSRVKSGLEELKAALDRAANATTRVKGSDVARLPIDRVFTIKGAGTVVTGTLWSGSVSIGDELEALPEQRRTRVRSIQIHGNPVECAHAGHRVALNLNGVSTDEVHPGDFLAEPGRISATDRFDADFTYLGVPDSDKPFESGSRVHISHGTREVVGRVLRIGTDDSLPKGNRTYAQIRLDEPLPVSWGDRFIVRSYSPVHVIGGGVVLRSHPKRSTSASPETVAFLDALRAGNALDAAKAAFSLQKQPVSAAELAAFSGCTVREASSALDSLVASRAALELQPAATSSEVFYTTTRFLQKMRSAIEKALLSFHSENPSSTGIAKDALRQQVAPRISPGCFDALLADACDHGNAVVHAGEVSHPQAGAGAKAREAEAAAKLLSALTQADATPPSLNELFESCSIDPALGRKAVSSLEDEGKVRRISKDLCFTCATLHAFEQAIRTRLANGASATAAELKDALRISRKYAIPLLEYFDDCGITRRNGDTRVLASR